MVMERYARIALVLIICGLPLMVLGYQWVLRPAFSTTRIVDIHMNAPEAGGFSRDVVQVNVGETVTLRFVADDVTHGIAIGPGLGVDLGAVDPGDAGEITLTIGRPGTYTYYCTTWCSPDHWRMRGVLQVRDGANPNAVPTVQADPVIAGLQAAGVNIDSTRTVYEPLLGADVSLPGKRIALGEWVIPADMSDESWRRTHTPAEASTLLQRANPQRLLEEVYRVVAYLWRDNDAYPSIDTKYLYNQNCAACHGQTGGGDGPGAAFTVVQPAAFSYLPYMFNMRSDVLYAKIRRGGMGTDMPNFGTILTPEETWALVDYLWQLALGGNSKY